MQEKQEVAALVKLAEKFEDEGNIVEAQKIDSILLKLAADAEEEKKEKEEGKKGFTAKQKAAIKRLHNAAEMFEKAFARGVPRGLAKKLDNICEDICEMCSGEEY